MHHSLPCRNAFNRTKNAFCEPTEWWMRDHITVDAGSQNGHCGVAERSMWAPTAGDAGCKWSGDEGKNGHCWPKHPEEDPKSAAHAGRRRGKRSGGSHGAGWEIRRSALLRGQFRARERELAAGSGRGCRAVLGAPHAPRRCLGGSCGEGRSSPPCLRGVVSWRL